MAAYDNVELKELESASEANSDTDPHIYHALESAECDRDLFSTDTDLPGEMEHPTYDKIKRDFGRPTSKPAPAFGSKENIVAESSADSTYDMIEHDASKESKKLVTDPSEKETTATEIPLYSAVNKRRKSSKLVDAKGNTKKAASVYDEIEKTGDTASVADLGYSQLNTSKHSSLHSCSTDANADDITEKPESNKQVNYSTFKQLVCIFLMAIVFVMVLICLVVLFVQVAQLKQQISVLKVDIAPSSQHLTDLMIELQDVDRRLGRTENRTDSCLCNNSSIEIINLNEMVHELNVSVNEYFSELNSSLDSSLQTAITQFTKRFAITSLELFSSLLLSENCSSFPSSSPSAYYWIRTTDDSIVRVYCDMERTCGGVEGGWMRVAELDMKDNNQECPNGLMLHNDSGIRTCVKNDSSSGCSAMLIYPSRVTYSSVCGRVTGYQVGSTNAFESNRTGTRTTKGNISTAYVDGVSITTNGSHIWTFAAALDQTGNFSKPSNCPCNGGPMPPSFVNESYFCDTAVQDFHLVQNQSAAFYNKTLWSEAVCGPSSDTCCTMTDPPWFYKALQQSTTDEIEIRLCRDEGRGSEDIAIESFEIYVQ